MNHALRIVAAGLFTFVLTHTPASAQATPPTPAVNPEAVVDLRTTTGISQVQGRWLYTDAHIANVPFKDAGPDRRPTGPANTTNEIQPASVAADTDESSWQTFRPRA